MAFNTVTVLSDGPVLAGHTTGTLRQFQIQATQTAAGPSPVGPLLDATIGVGMQGAVVSLEDGNNAAGTTVDNAAGQGLIPVLNGTAQTVSWQNLVLGTIVTNPGQIVPDVCLTVLIRC